MTQSAATYFGTIPYTEEEKQRIANLLRQNLGDEYISRREGPGGSSVSYIEGWKILDLANDIFGFNGWANSIIRMDVLICDFINNKWSIGIDCTVRVTLRDGSYHEDVGWGSGTGRDKGATMEKARKEAVTDGLKRVLKTFGSVMGNCIYQKDYQKRLWNGAIPEETLYKRPRTDAGPPSIPGPPPPIRNPSAVTNPHPAAIGPIAPPSTVGSTARPIAAIGQQYRPSSSSHLKTENATAMQQMHGPTLHQAPSAPVAGPPPPLAPLQPSHVPNQLPTMNTAISSTKAMPRPAPYRIPQVLQQNALPQKEEQHHSLAANSHVQSHAAQGTAPIIKTDAPLAPLNNVTIIRTDGPLPPLSAVNGAPVPLGPNQHQQHNHHHQQGLPPR